MITLEALKGNMTLNEITKKYGVHATQINNWKRHLKQLEEENRKLKQPVVDLSLDKKMLQDVLAKKV